MNLCLLFPIDESKRVIVETGGIDRDITRKEVQLVHAWRAKLKHPRFRFSKFRAGDWYVASTAFDVRKFGLSRYSKAVDLGNCRAGRVRGNSEDVGGAII
jgi:hypothetical protein